MNLVPEKRIDRNGKVVTRHVKVAVSAIPSVGIPSPQLINASLDADRTKLYEMFRPYASIPATAKQEQDDAVWKATVEGLSPVVIEAASEIIRTYPDSRHVRNTLDDVIKRVSYYDSPDALAMDIRFIASCSQYHNLNTPAFSYYQVRKFCYEYTLENAGLDKYDDELTEPLYRQAISMGHVIIAAGLKDGDDPSSPASDFKNVAVSHPELVALALARPERGEEIARFIQKRGTDIELVRAYVNDPASALKDGIL